MAKNYNADQLAIRIFMITMAAVVLYVGAVFLFIL